MHFVIVWVLLSMSWDTGFEIQIRRHVPRPPVIVTHQR